MEGPPLGPGGEDITWPDQVAPRGRKASSTRKIKPQTSNLNVVPWHPSPRGPPPIANVEPQVLHRLLQKLQLLQLYSGVVLLGDRRERAQVDQVILQSIYSRAYIIDVGFHLGAS